LLIERGDTSKPGLKGKWGKNTTHKNTGWLKNFLIEFVKKMERRLMLNQIIDV